MRTLAVVRHSCLCSNPFPASSPDVRFGSTVSFSAGPELFEILRPVQTKKLSCNSEDNSFTDHGSISEYHAFLETFPAAAVQCR